MWANFEFLDLHNASRKKIKIGKTVAFYLWVASKVFVSGDEAKRKDMVDGLMVVSYGRGELKGYLLAGEDGSSGDEKRHVCLNEYSLALLQ